MKAWKEWLSTIVTFVLVFLLVIGLQKFVIQPVRVDGTSMDYTLEDGERLLMYKLAQVDRFDVVVLESPAEPGRLVIKRVIGLAGDSIEVINGQLLINGQAMNEPYLAQKEAEYPGYFTAPFSLADMTGVTHIPEGYLFVMGDNRRHSVDSRTYGLVPIENVRGQTSIIYWPFNKMGLLDRYDLNAEGTEILKR